MVSINGDYEPKGKPTLPSDWWVKQNAKNPEQGIFDDLVNKNIEKDLGSISVFRKDKS